MAAIAVVGRRRVQRAFTGGGVTVVAATALIRRLGVINRRVQWNPCIAGVTGVTQVCGERMCRRLKRMRANAIMTTGTGARLSCHRGMIERADQPRGGACMTAIAWRRGNYMVGSFTGGDGAVMTAVARCRGLTVVYG